MQTISIWLVAALLYGSFWVWYSGWRPPLTPTEIDGFMARIEHIEQYKEDAAIKARLRGFLEKDDGGEFFMVNLIRMRDKALPIAGARPDETPRQVLDHYSTKFMPTILAHAGWLVTGGRAAASGDLEQWGVKPDADWQMFGLVRYRSRRDMLEVISKPEFDSIHPFKFASMEATRAFPVAPAILTLGPKVVVGLVVLVLALSAQLLAGYLMGRS
jgi:hypothetical protein